MAAVDAVTRRLTDAARRRLNGSVEIGGLTPAAAAAQPVYTPVRYNEDYLYLREPAKRTDFLDPLKYIPLNDAGDWYLSLGGSARYRYELFNNNNFGAGPQDDDGFHLLRLLAHADARTAEETTWPPTS